MDRPGFSVDWSALRQVPPLFERIEEDAHAAQVHLARYTTLGRAGVLLEMLRGHHERIVGELSEFLGQVADPTTGEISRRLRDAIGYYRATDQAAAARLDSSYRPADAALIHAHASVPDSSGPAPVADVIEPELTFQPPPPDLGAQFSPALSWTDVFSPTSLARGLCWEVTAFGAHLGVLDGPVDPFEWFVRPFLGDWPALLVSAHVFRQVGRGCGQIAVNLQANQHALGQVWAGNAAGAVLEFMIRLRLALGDVDEVVRPLADRYTTVAADVYDLITAMGDALGDLADGLAMAIVDIQLATATAETVVGGIVFGAAAMWSMYEVANAVATAWDVAAAAHRLLSGATPTLEALGFLALKLDLPRLPTVPAMPA